MPKPLVDKPVGPSKGGEGFWNNQRYGTTHAVTCEICGTNYPERDTDDESYTISTFLGMQVVEECCGAIIDRVYQESGEEFAIAFLEEFAKSPTDPRFGIFLMVLKSTISTAEKMTLEVMAEVSEMNDQLTDINS
jgi:hypothetical protein